jgi:hypothetical protein
MFRDSPTRKSELKSKHIIPVLMLVGYVFVNLYGKWPRGSWILLIAAAVSVIFDHYSSFKNAFSRWSENRADRTAAEKAFPELQEFVRRFGDFVNRQAGDTFHFIVESDIYHGQLL